MVQADEQGVFSTGMLPPGTYTVAAWFQGFRALKLTGIVLRADETIDLGKIRLEMAGCDAPGVICDNFGLGAPGKGLATGYLDLKLNCGVDLDNGAVYCPDRSGVSQREGASADLIMARKDGGVYLAPVNGATTNPPNLPSANCHEANRGNASVRLDGLGPGDDICLYTRTGRLSHVFLVSEVYRGSTQVTIWYVTRRP